MLNKRTSENSFTRQVRQTADRPFQINSDDAQKRRVAMITPMTSRDFICFFLTGSSVIVPRSVRPRALGVAEPTPLNLT